MKLGVELRQSFMASRARNIRSTKQVLRTDVAVIHLNKLAEDRSVSKQLFPLREVFRAAFPPLQSHRLGGINVADRFADPSSFLNRGTDRRRDQRHWIE